MKQLCSSCGNKRITKITGFNNIPISGYVVETKEKALNEPRFELTLLQCDSCGLIQLKRTGEMLKKLQEIYQTYQPTYSMSEGARQYMFEMIQRLSDVKHTPNDLFLEIGCNDGSSLEIARDFDWDVLGIEPSKALSRMCKVPVINEFFNTSVVDSIVKYKTPRIILVRHVLEHAPDLAEFITCIKKCMNEKTILMIEVPDYNLLIDNFHWEGIAHPHLYYFTTRSIENLLERNGIHIISYEAVPTDGGSLLVAASVASSQKASRFEKKVKTHITEISVLLEDMSKEGKVVYGFGAGKGSTILNEVGTNGANVKFVIDDNKEKQGLFIPGCGIEIKSDEYLLPPHEPDYLILLAPTHTDEIKKKLMSRFPSRKFKFVDLIPEIIIEQ